MYKEPIKPRKNQLIEKVQQLLYRIDKRSNQKSNSEKSVLQYTYATDEPHYQDFKFPTRAHR